MNALFDDLFAKHATTEESETEPAVEEFAFAQIQAETEAESLPEETASEPAVEEEKPLVYEVTLEELMAMVD